MFFFISPCIYLSMSRKDQEKQLINAQGGTSPSDFDSGPMTPFHFLVLVLPQTSVALPSSTRPAVVLPIPSDIISMPPIIITAVQTMWNGVGFPGSVHGKIRTA
ncbi:hypothetical protein ACRALDRAFT_207779 [Sodiomyces alcalophilus JCM 7366]|uniref:uncharacterized protein n=1 Tax=Sodiomyces alcalophilus JCM 7366 TaxID=591952 RepID=UPI0039B4D82D